MGRHLQPLGQVLGLVLALLVAACGGGQGGEDDLAVDCLITPAAARDQDAEPLVSQVTAAQDAAFAKRADAWLTSILIGPAVGGTPAYIALQDGREMVQVSFPADRNPFVQTGVKTEGSPSTLTNLLDLEAGPARVLEVATQQYPDVKPIALTLSRRDCQLVWSVIVTQNERGKAISVTNTGQILRIEDVR